MSSGEMKKIIPGKLWWSGKGFLNRGLWVWAGRHKRNIRLIPLNNFRNWTGKESNDD